jgi:alpha-tubulin suppressor-like RCC1 family protein
MDALAVELGTNAVDVGIGNRYTCALTDAGSVRCWGLNDVGQLGLGHKMNIGDDEPPKAAGDLSLGGKAVQLVVTESHACALLELGAVRCWGRGAFDEGTAGMLGYGSKEHVGDDELPSAVGPVDLPGPVERLATGARHTCAVLRDGQMFCWGANLYGQLGLGHTDDIGDDETPAVAGAVDVAPVIDLALYANGTCVLFEDGTVQCWGDGLAGSHGHGHTNTLGDDELPATLPLLELGGGEFVQLAAGGAHVCARTAEGVLRCWGFNHRGQLGYGHTMDIGDDELPASAGPVQYE